MSQDKLHKGNFLARNRIVAGLCDCLVVAESAEKGGALVTAKIATAYNRDVAALPGRISDKFSAGCNKLIASNIATLIRNDEDIIDLMGWRTRPAEGEQQELNLSLSPEEENIIKYLQNAGEETVNQLCVAARDSNAQAYAVVSRHGIQRPYPPLSGGKYRHRIKPHPPLLC